VDAATSESFPVNGEPLGDLGRRAASAFSRELAELNEWDFDLILTGFDPGAIDRLLAIPDEERATAAPPLQTITLQREQLKISRTILSSDRNGSPAWSAIPALIRTQAGQNAVSHRNPRGGCLSQAHPTCQNFNRRVSCSRRAGWEATAWPKNGELRLPI
jgi:hypothetical protein